MKIYVSMCKIDQGKIQNSPTLIYFYIKIFNLKGSTLADELSQHMLHFKLNINSVFLERNINSIKMDALPISSLLCSVSLSCPETSPKERGHQLQVFGNT